MGRVLRIIKWFTNTATWTKALILLVMSQLFYFLMLKITIPNIRDHSNNIEIFDLMPFGYSPEYTFRLLEVLGDEGRFLYLTTQIPLDLIYPGLMGMTGAFFIALLNKRINHRFEILIILPLIAAIFDYLENISVSAMLLIYPSVSSGLVYISSTFTILKSMMTTVYLVLLIVLFIVYFFIFIKNYKKKSIK